MRSLILAASIAAVFATMPAAAAPSAPPATGGGGSSTPAGGATTAFGTNTTTTVPTNNTNPFGAGGSFSNDSGNSGLGRSEGQTSTGTAVGNSGSGVGSAFDPSDVNTQPPTNPDGSPAIVSGVNPGVSRVVTVPAATPTRAAAATPSSTPLFDQATRAAMERERARRARGEQPRVYGIAPNTNNDLSRQMPDDPIIRY